MRPSRISRLLRSALAAAVAGAGLACAAQPALAAPYTPASDEVVLEVLPAASSELARELAAERRTLARTPGDLSRAAALAWRYVEAGRSAGDPRYTGLAEGVIAPWLASAEPPTDALLLRATLRQNRHDFAGAESDLAALLARDPRHAQAWLTRATVAKVRGDFALAQASCVPLLRLADALTATTCLADVASLSGRAAPAERALAAALERSPRAPAPQRQWALVTLAEIRERRGDARGAEASYQAALALASDAYTVSAYADFLLDARRARDALALLGDDRRADGLLLRRALAERALRAPGLETTLRELRARFAAGRMRGERLHAGEEARFALAFGDAREALSLARESFASQREPRDVRVLLEAALAAR
ncbi:MAG TPA: hypothetical protein VFT98_14355, partial [Myxococcota bacterium]|nr:hypothetical protein [Myxococcota bacterium]